MTAEQACVALLHWLAAYPAHESPGSNQTIVGKKMDFARQDRNQQIQVAFPQELVGYWRIGNQRYEFRANGRYYVHDLNIPYELIDSGMTLVFSGTRYSRRYGSPDGLPGVWFLEGDSTEEWNLRNDGSYTYHWPGYEYFGEYTFDEGSISTAEMRAVLSESSGTLIFDPPYSTNESGQWSINEPVLAIVFSSVVVEYTRET